MVRKKPISICGKWLTLEFRGIRLSGLNLIKYKCNINI